MQRVAVGVALAAGFGSGDVVYTTFLSLSLIQRHRSNAAKNLGLVA
jgi:hypothetical protein